MDIRNSVALQRASGSNRESVRERAPARREKRRSWNVGRVVNRYACAWRTAHGGNSGNARGLENANLEPPRTPLAGPAGPKRKHAMKPVPGNSRPRVRKDWDVQPVRYRKSVADCAECSRAYVTTPANGVSSVSAREKEYAPRVRTKRNPAEIAAKDHETAERIALGETGQLVPGTEYALPGSPKRSPVVPRPQAEFAKKASVTKPATLPVSGAPGPAVRERSTRKQKSVETGLMRIATARTL